LLGYIDNIDNIDNIDRAYQDRDIDSPAQPASQPSQRARTY
jgi:hypothetical protein